MSCSLVDGYECLKTPAASVFRVEIYFLTMNMEVKVFQKLWNLCSELHVISQKAMGPNLHSYNLRTSNLARNILLNRALTWI
jgi:hypothetical protein